MAGSLRACRVPILTATVAVTLGVSACGRTTAASGSLRPTSEASVSEAANSPATVLSTSPGSTPFISFVAIVGAPVEELAQVEFTIAPKPGSVSKPVHVRYGPAALSRQGYPFAEGPSSVFTAAGFIKLPVFGLYAGFQNQVLVQLDFQDGSTKSLPVVIATAPYTDPNGIYDRPTILVPRVAGSALGFDFFVMKSNLGSPVIVDTDAEIRWVGAGVVPSLTSALTDDGFVVGSQTTPTIYHLGFDGSVSSSSPPSPPYFNFHHNIDGGKDALFFEVDTYDNNNVQNIETTFVDMDPDGTIDQTWNLAEILSSYMRSQGDDPTAFVRPGVDWFHMNAATYDPSDDSVIVSSRENFLIKLDYSTGNIKWILGDPTKYWYTFQSLRAKALTLAPGGLYPIGQHAVSITSDGLVMVMNDGLNSENQPAGEPAGETRTFSAVSAYSIDPVNRVAQEIRRFDYGQTIFAPICGSSYEAPGRTYLVDFATADDLIHARLVGLDSNLSVVFDFQYSNTGCNSSWNATPIALDDLAIL